MGDDISITLNGRLGNFRLDVDFVVPIHGITALFGPSGCGKTSILRSVAGLNRLPGSIRIADEIWQDDTCFVPTHKRSLGYVFQEASLFPHLSVLDNLIYGEKRAKRVRKYIKRDEIIDLLGISALIDRSPEHLSGGERQRVAIGRALLSQPRLLLMDEPMSALDRFAKDEILPYLERLHSSLKIPTLLVTHDMSEVERLADHLVLLEKGNVLRSGPLSDILSAPDSPLAARRDFASVLSAQVLRTDNDGICTLDVAGAEFLVLADHLAAGDQVRLRILAGDVSIARGAHLHSSILNAIPARITDIAPLGPHEASLRLDIGKHRPAIIRARITRRSLSALDLQPGDSVIGEIKSVSLTANR